MQESKDFPIAIQDSRFTPVFPLVTRTTFSRVPVLCDYLYYVAVFVSAREPMNLYVCERSGRNIARTGEKERGPNVNRDF